MHTIESLDLIAAHIRAAINGERITDPTEETFTLYLAAADELLNRLDGLAKDNALQALGLVALSAMNHRLRAAAVCAKAANRARLS